MDLNSNRSNRPVNRSNQPVNRSEPVARELLNLDLNLNRSNRPVNRLNRLEPVARDFLNLFKFGFEFNRFLPVTGQTGPVNRYRRAAV